jgi:hypothetical protein
LGDGCHNDLEFALNPAADKPVGGRKCRWFCGRRGSLINVLGGPELRDQDPPEFCSESLLRIAQPTSTTIPDPQKAPPYVAGLS